MACSNPIYAVRLGVINPDTGKEKIKVLPKRVGEDLNYLKLKYGSDNVLALPCGHCSYCKQKKSREWASRMVLEASCYEKNCFVTLTYKPECLPKGGLCKKDLQGFLHRLQNRFPGVRYFACGEYGSNTLRPHYHLVIFNWFPDDAKFVCKGVHGGMYFTSNILNDLWPFGLTSLGLLDFASCAYVARYCNKKVNKPGLLGEFSLMSKKPGLGQRFFDLQLYETDKIYYHFSNSIHSISNFRYFDKLLERVDSSFYEKVKNQRISKSNLLVASEMLLHGFEYVEQLENYKSEILTSRFKKLVRKDI